MPTLIKGGLVVAMGGELGDEPQRADILIDGDHIVALGQDLEPHDAYVVPADNHAVIPGLINAHIHSEQNLFRGRYAGSPLEVFMLYAYPMVRAVPLPPRLVYLRTMLAGMESLKTGVTCILDDVIEVPGQSLDQLEAVFKAYEDLGIRANCSGHVINKYFTDTVPFLEEILPPELRANFREMPPPTTESYLEFAEEAVSRFHGRHGRLSFVVAPSGPQRCTDDLLVAAADFADQYHTPYHIHILETKTQVVTGELFYGKTLIRHMHDLGALRDRVSIAHAIWVTDEDIDLIADSGASIAHNPVCNLRIGSGIAPLRKFLNAGINVALGTDGISSNDTARIFDVMHVAALVHNISTPDFESWPSATEILRAATVGGARAVRLEKEIGTVEVGKKADLVLLRLDTPSFLPLNDVRKHLVFSENGASVDTVFVNGEPVLDKGRLTRLDEEALIAEIQEAIPEFLAHHERVEEFNRRFEPYFAEVHHRCFAHDIGMNRYSTSPEQWLEYTRRPRGSSDGGRLPAPAERPWARGG